MITAPMMMSGVVAGTPANALHSKVITGNIGTGVVGSTVVFNGFVDRDGNAFTPIAIVVERFRQTSLGFISGNPGTLGGFGFATASAQRSYSFYEAFNALAATTRSSHRSDCVGHRYENNNNVSGRFSVQSFGSGSVTFVIDQQYTVSEWVIVTAFGGANFDARLITITEPATTGAHAVSIASGPGLVPVGVLLGSVSLASAMPATRTDIAVMMGAAAVGGGQAVFAGGSNQGSDPTVCGQHINDSECIALIDLAITGINGRASLTGAAVDELTFTWAETSATSRLIGALVFFGCGVDVKTFACPSGAGGTTVVSGLGGTPRGGLLFAGMGRTAMSTVDVVSAEDFRLSVGAFDSTSSQATVTWHDNHADATTSPATSAATGAVLQDIDASLLSTYDVSAIGSSSFTVHADNAGNASIAAALLLRDP